MGGQPAQHGVGVLGVAQVPGAVELVQAREGKAGGVADVVQPCGGFQQIGVSADLRIYWDEIDGRIAEAWCQGTMYRGYEMILIGRYPDDALATTARLCGICSTSHVVAATHALEDAWNITPPPQAVRLRNLFLAAESVMSDARQGALFFGPGLCDQSFSWHPLYPEITDAFQTPFAGWLTRQVRDFSKRILGVITAFTRQWPHSVPFRPGGATCPVGADDIRHARAAVDD
jgi:uptake hydrogenase large subunit